MVFYLISGLAAAGQILVTPDSTLPSLGASGAISGVLGAYLVLYPRARVLTWVPVFLFLVIRIPAIVFLGLWFGFQFV
ncbi:MAG: rhomboid family intramembrane serine protease, partial [Dehalococcoidia bacterium]|nr:rhomboid family intramembrane serine protease [Dehalococcoidia bacterium]